MADPTFSLAGQNIYEPQNMFTALPLSDKIYSIYGTTATVIDKDEASIINNYGLLKMRADKGSFTIRLGDYHTSGMPAAAVPTEAITDGSGGWLITEGQELILPNPQKVTVKGYVSTSVLTYMWV